MQTISGVFTLTKNMALMLMDCIEVGICGCEENEDNSDAELEAMRAIARQLDISVQTLEAQPDVGGVSSVDLSSQAFRAIRDC